MKPRLHRSMGLVDVALYFLIASTNLQWVAASAAAGPTSLFAWLIGCLAMFGPLCIVVVYLSARYPREGGMYVWVTRAFGPFAGFITAWTYWYSTLAYFPALLYFTAGNALYLTGKSPSSAGSPAFFIAFSLGGLLIGTLLNVLGLQMGKKLVNVAAVCRTAMIAVLVGFGIAVAMKHGFATALTPATLRPTFDLKELIFLSVIAFAFVGPESLPFMAEEVRDPNRSIPRGLALAAPLIVGIYVIGTLAVFAIIKPSNADSLYSVMQSSVVAAGQIGGVPLVVGCAVLVVLSCLGSLTAWLGANARLPFVAGIDNYLPASFSWLHPRWGSPLVSLLVQCVIAAILVIIGQGGTSVKGAYDVLVSSTVLGTMIPFILMFAAGLKFAEGKPLVAFASIIGFCTVIGAMLLSAFPGADDPNKALAVIKIVGLNVAMVAIGIAFFAARRRVAAVTA